jgi:hypothetical protein
LEQMYAETRQGAHGSVVMLLMTDTGKVK